ncbi:MAG: aspartate/glutamate racemase family protein [Bdellovibrionales bacterium]|nr:aspartate/glutamate racemase family protein [Bdellovibrionales bacterium]
MAKIGLIGGMSWESTATYYQAINRHVRELRGGLHSAELVLESLDFSRIEPLQRRGAWQECASILSDAAVRLEAAGAEAVLLCTNTMHKVADEIEASISIPFLHIADVTAEEVLRRGASCVGLLGTRFTMEEAFYRERLRERFGLQVVCPCSEDQAIVHSIIYDELCVGEVLHASRQEYVRIIERLQDEGAEAVLLACTEIGLLVTQADTKVALIDTTIVHAQAAARFSVES